MNKDNMMFGTICVCIVVVFLSIPMVAIYGIYKNFEFTNKAIEAGYVQGNIPGQAGVYWVKPDGSQCKCLEKGNR